MPAHPLLAIWLAFAAYSACAIVLVQFWVLPVMAPGLHAGQGLLAGTDAVGYHAIAKALAESMRVSGWSAWMLAPQGHTAAGLAAPFYYLLGTSPASLIPLNATLHATGGVLVVCLLRQFGVRLRSATAAASLWIAYPSSLQWVTQISKDVFFFAGMLGALLGWTMMLHHLKSGAGTARIYCGAVLLVCGTVIAGIVRLYAFQLLLLPACAFALLFIPQLVRNVRNGISAHGHNLAITAIALIIPIILAAAPRDIRIEPVPLLENPRTTDAATTEITAGKNWQTTASIPSPVDRTFLRLAIARRAYTAETYKSAGSMIDLDQQFYSAADVVAYLPRALQIGLLAPFPSQWFTQGASQGGTTMRLVAGAEMLMIYPLLLLGLPLAIWRWHRNLEFWFAAGCCVYLIVTYAMVTPNLGTLYRMRYGYLMTLAATGFAAIFTTLQERRRPKS